MAITFPFPPSPTVGQVVTLTSGEQMQWNGYTWVDVTGGVTYPITIAKGGTSAMDAPTARTNLGLGGAALLADPVPVANGGTAGTTIATALANLGIPTHDKLFVGSQASGMEVAAIHATGTAGLIVDGGTAKDVYLAGRRLGKNRWQIFGATGEAETGGNVGSNFGVARFDDAGNWNGWAMVAARNTGSVTYPNTIFLSPGSGSAVANLSGYGATASKHGLLFYPNENTSYPCVFHNTSQAQVGLIYCTATATSYNTSSDYRLKHDIVDLQGGLQAILALQPRSFRWNADDSAATGFIAHELQTVIPSAVSGEKDAVNEDGSIRPQGTDLSFVIPWVVKAVQELSTRVQALEGA